MSVAAPTGKVTLVFTDVEGSSTLWDALPADMRRALGVHDELLHALIKEHDGYEVKTVGDAFMIAFASPIAAVRWATEVQRRLPSSPWPEGLLAHPQASAVSFQDHLVSAGLRVRIGIHTGEPECTVNDRTGRMDYFGPMVNRAARIAGAAHGGQVLTSNAVKDAVGGDPSFRFRPVGVHHLKGLKEPEALHDVRAADLPDRVFPAPRTQQKKGLRVFAGLGALAMVLIAAVVLTRGDGDPASRARLSRLTSNPQELPISAFALSPDGTELAFSDPRGIRIETLESKEERHFAVGLVDVRGISWSRHSGDLIIAAHGGPKGGGVYRMDPHDGDLALVVAGAPYSAAELPDGVVFSSNAEITVFTKSGGQRVLYRSPPPFKPLKLAASPVGDRLAVIEARSGAVRLKTLMLDGVTHIVSEDPGLRLSGAEFGIDFRGGELLYLLSESIGGEQATNVWSVPLGNHGQTKGTPRRLTRFNGTQLNALSVSSQDGRVAVRVVTSQDDVFVGTVGGQPPALSSISRLSLHEGSDVTAGWLADGRVVFVSDRGRFAGPWAQRPGQLEAVFLGPEDAWMARPEIAPDGVGLFGFIVGPELAKGSAASILSLRTPDGGFRRIREVLPQATLRRQTRAPSLKHAIRCGEHPGAGCVLATETTADQLCLERLDDDGELVAPLGCVPLPIPSRTWDLSPDGRTLSYVLPEAVGVVSLAGSGMDASVEPSPLALPNECRPLNPALGAGLLFSASCLGHPALLAGVDGGLIELPFESMDPVTSIAISRDGGRLAFTQRRVDADIYLVEGIAR